MNKYFKSSSILLGAVLITSLASCAEAQQPTSNASKSEIETIVKDYLLENPEIIREALILLQEKEERAQIVAVKDELHNNKGDYSIGPKNARVTVVEFFDYNCSYCKSSTGWVQEIVKKHPKDVRVIFKELPILDRRTKTSRNAAIAALAAGRQGKYSEMHFALMDARDLSQNKIKALAKEIGLNMTEFALDQNDEKLAQQVENNMELAQRIPGLSGTPFFVINEQFLASGNALALQNMLDQELDATG